MPADNNPLYPKPKQTHWLKTAWQSIGYFLLYFITVSLLALVTTSVKFYSAETGFHYKSEHQAAVEAFIAEAQQKYNLSDSEFILEQTTGKYNTLVVNLAKPTPEDDNELLIYDLHNNELLIFDYDNAYVMDNQSSMSPTFIGLYALLTLLVFIFWRKNLVTLTYPQARYLLGLA